MKKLPSRGFFGIGVYNPKTEVNIGTLWRSAFIFGADFIFTIGSRYKKQASDTLATYRHVPLWKFDTFQQFKDAMPLECRLVCVELTEKSQPLNAFKHPERAVYLLGAEDYGLPKLLTTNEITVQIPTRDISSLNVAVAGSIILYDRVAKGMGNAALINS